MSCGYARFPPAFILLEGSPRRCSNMLEDNVDEGMHSGADVEAFTAALNQDIGGDVAAFSQPSEPATVDHLDSFFRLGTLSPTST